MPGLAEVLTWREVEHNPLKNPTTTNPKSLCMETAAPSSRWVSRVAEALARGPKSFTTSFPTTLVPKSGLRVAVCPHHELLTSGLLGWPSHHRHHQQPAVLRGFPQHPSQTPQKALNTLSSPGTVQNHLKLPFFYSLDPLTCCFPLSFSPLVALLHHVFSGRCTQRAQKTCQVLYFYGSFLFFFFLFSCRLCWPDESRSRH